MGNKNAVKLISIFCLGVYLLFGFINISHLGICFGHEDNKHIGLIIAGKATCCKESHDRDFKQISFTDECDDFYFDLTPTVQNFSPFENINLITNQIAPDVTHNFNRIFKNNKLLLSHDLRGSPPVYYWLNSKIIHDSINLII